MEYILRLELKRDKGAEPHNVGGKMMFPTLLGTHPIVAASDEEARQKARALIRRAIRADLYKLMEAMVVEKAGPGPEPGAAEPEGKGGKDDKRD